MVPDNLSRAHLPALLLVVIGLCLVIYSGVHLYDLSRTEYTYNVDEVGDERYADVYGYASLSSDGQQIVEVGRQSAQANSTVAGNTRYPAPEFEVGSGPHYILMDGNYYCLELRQSESGSIRTQTGNFSITAEQQCLQNSSEHHDGFYPNSSALSADARDMLASATEASDGEITRYGSSPPEFEDGADAPSFGWGYYIVEYDGTFYRLFVSQRGSGPLGGIAAYFFLLSGGLGLGITVVGTKCYERERINEPVALLSSIAIIGGSITLYSLGLLSDEFLDEQFWTIIISSIVVPVVLWALLTWRR